MKKYMISMGAALCFGLAVQAQQKSLDTTQRSIELDEVVISAGNFYEKKRNVVQRIDVISEKTIRNTNAQNTGDLLIQTGKAFVQKSQQGGSSPVLRGFEASRILLVVDGVRMNNAIYRSGHLQNIITTDQNSFSSLEVMQGPASTTYGSDALGGIIHMRTKDPVLSTNNKIHSTGSGFMRYSSANREKTGHFDISIGGQKFAWFQSWNYSDFGDMRMGRQYPDRYPNFGRRTHYIQTINGRDTVLRNADDRVQRFSGYRQWDIIQKLLFVPNSKQRHLLNFQVSNSSNIPRYDRLQDIRNGQLRFAEWYYGPQKRLLGAYEFQYKGRGWLEDFKINLNYQDIEESRYTREFRRYDRFDARIEHVKVAGFTVASRRKWNQQELIIGVDGQFNRIQSRASRTNLRTGEIRPLDTRYPDGRNRMNHFGLYAQHIYKSRNGKLVLNDGIRLQYSQLSSQIENNLLNLPVTSVRQNNFAITGNIGANYQLSTQTTLRSLIATAFRAPNLDDLAKIFESSTAARQVVIPNANIKPEYTYSVELGVVHQLASGIRVEVLAYHTWFRNALVKAPFQLNGADSILYDGVLSQVLANQNRNRARVWGIGTELNWKIHEGLQLTSSLHFTQGRFQTRPGEKSAVYERQPNGTYQLVQKQVRTKPLDHIPPVYGRTALDYTRGKWQSSLFALYNGWKRLDQFNADGEDNAQYATPDGMPSWVTLNWRMGWQCHPNWLLQVGVENIFDRNYRYFASGFSAPGRNISLSVRANW